MNDFALSFNREFIPNLRNICNILIEDLDIHWFEYTRIYRDGKRFYITNNQSWLEYFLKNDLQDDIEENKILWGSNDKRYTLWSGLNKNNVLSAYYKHNMWNGIIAHHILNKDYRDCFSFSSTIQNKHVNNIFINNTDIIKKIILLFNKDIYIKLPIDDDKYFIKTNHKTDLTLTETLEVSEEKILDFYEKTKIDRYYINQKKSDFYLTRMEFLCLTLLSHGKQIKDIAKECLISPRTVESHINSIKLKSGYTQREKLISIITDSEFPFSKSYIKYI